MEDRSSSRAAEVWLSLMLPPCEPVHPETELPPPPLLSLFPFLCVSPIPELLLVGLGGKQPSVFRNCRLQRGFLEGGQTAPAVLRWLWVNCNSCNYRIWIFSSMSHAVLRFTCGSPPHPQWQHKVWRKPCSFSLTIFMISELTTNSFLSGGAHTCLHGVMRSAAWVSSWMMVQNS